VEHSNDLRHSSMPQPSVGRLVNEPRGVPTSLLTGESYRRRCERLMADTKVSYEFLGTTNSERAARCRALALAPGQLAAEAANSHSRKTHFDMQKRWNRLAEEFDGRIKPQSEAQLEALADFMNRGGHVAKLPDSIPVGAPEVLAYLASQESM